ncbi:hypothetical protein O2K51_12060 [Apibacter raozihei]|uniref:RHS repeat-associated core domain-containing protein n=1 Tax=Apibacter raozihei TaxID=2500547 RepID=UPI0013E29836|nr:RHS repeat-associated core domain-containing protein [Apibacter raozihei]
MGEETGLYNYGARYYNPRESVWLSTDPLSGYNPVMEVEHYIDGQHNGGVFNSFNHNTYGYCYQSPVHYVDPNGKQASAIYGTDPAGLLDPSNFKTSTPKTTGALYGSGRTLNWLGNNNVHVSGKPGTEAGTVTKGTSRASKYLRYDTNWGAAKLPKGLHRRLPKKISLPVLGTTPIKTDTWGGLAGRTVPVVGRGLVVVGVAGSLYNISTAEDKSLAAVHEGGTWAGVIAGAETGASFGTSGGPWGIAAGGIVGGIAGESAIKNLTEPLVPCGSCVKPSQNYLEEGMRTDGGLKAAQDNNNQNKNN